MSSILTRIRAQANGRIQQRANSLLGGAQAFGSGAAINVGGNIAARVSDAQNAVLGRAFEAVNSDTVLGRAAGRFAEQLGIRRPSRNPALPVPGPRAQWTPAPVFGGVSSADFYDLWRSTAMIAHGYKNLFYINIEERRASLASPGGVPSSLNLLAVDVSFAPFTTPGEQVNLGSANLDNLAQAERVEMRVTTFDDDRGSIKRWYYGKADQATHRDGTFGLPDDYLVTIRLTHMAPTNAGSDDARFRNVYLMRPANIEIELSRRDPALEELQLSFVQFDTFMEVV